MKTQVKTKNAIWNRVAASKQPDAFYVYIRVEGYRPDKDQWIAGIQTCQTIDEAIALRDEIYAANDRGELEKYCNEDDRHIDSLEDISIVEYNGGAKYYWERTHIPWA